MKKALSILVLFIFLFSLTSCIGTPTSNKKYKEIENYVLENIDTLSPDNEIEFFDYEASGLSIDGIYYGYYYSENNEILLPDFYRGNDLDIIKDQKYEDDKGTYFGKPNNGTDWCYIKEITEHWYYYELHWA